MSYTQINEFELPTFTVTMQQHDQGPRLVLKFHFNNGYIASVSHHNGILSTYGASEGKFEIAVIHSSDPKSTLTGFDCVDGDVVGWCDSTDMVRVCHEISLLPPREVKEDDNA